MSLKLFFCDNLGSINFYKQRKQPTNQQLGIAPLSFLSFCNLGVYM